MKHLLHTDPLLHAYISSLRQNAVDKDGLTTKKSNQLPFKLKVKFFLLKLWLTQRSKSQLLLLSLAIFSLPVSLIALSFMLPQKLNFSYSGVNCVFAPTLLPNTVKKQAASEFTIIQKPKVSIGNHPVISTQTCLKLNALPDEESGPTKQAKLTAVGVLHKQITISMPSLPDPSLATNLEQDVAPSTEIYFTLDRPDATFNYYLSIEDQSHTCQNSTTELVCSLATYDLTQGASYTYNLTRSLLDSTQAIVSGTLQLHDPISVLESSIVADSIVYDSPKTITLTTDKILNPNNYELSLQTDSIIQATTISIADNTVTIALSELMQRQKRYELNVTKLEALDGSYLEEAYNLSFETSGGPKVQGISIGNYDFNPASSLLLSFDSQLEATTANTEFVTITAGGLDIPIDKIINGSTIRIVPRVNLPTCSDLTVTVIDGLTNVHGVSGGSAWSMNSRTTCKQTFSIGTSVQGRSIIGYRFGSGPVKILFVGGLHGDEKSSVRTLSPFIDDLEKNYSSIPADKTIIVIPNVNPDGYIASTRLNANNIDLNRNFPSFDWTTEAYLPRGIFLANGGGITALSEPESSALATYTSTIAPRMTLTFHATGRAVFANGSGDSQNITNLYAEKSGFTAYAQSDEDAFFEYPTTGEYENWMNDKLGLPTILVELASVGNNEFTRQRSALWAMVGL